ncbi:MAG TPA: protein kinase [Gemmatimonadaceae bacterium]|nr:protein kinase [Gemmatimonadaceae bacterium]
MSSDLQSQLQTTLGDGYRVDRELPGGGMSRVFVAHDRALARDIVVKVLPPDMAAAVSIQRFNREIQLAARLQHPHIVPLHATGEISGLPYFTMPFVEGDSLRAHLSQQGELPLPECVRILRDVATALAYAHRHGVVHRDIKPENVLLTSGSAVVTDFGVGKALSASTGSGVDNLTTRGVAVGTPAYMSPEQAAADPTMDHRSDIYSWGILAYEMITGQPPFAGRSAGALIAAQIAEAPEAVERKRPTVPHALGGLVMRCLAKRPADRPQRAEELVNLLDALIATGLSSGSVQAGRKTPWRKAQPWVGIAAGVSAVLLAAAVLLAPKIDLNPTGATAPQPVRSIAVLPFLNLGGNQADEYFSDGMSDELSTALGKIPGLQVASRTSTFSFRGDSNADVRAIGERLKVDAVLEGRVRRAGDRLRLFVQLTNVADGLSLWSESYEREVKDVFAVQEDVARAIAEALEVRLAGAGAAASPAVADAGTSDLAAYDLYLRGRYQWHRRNLAEAGRLFEQAAAKDPSFARAHAGIAITYALLPEYVDFSPEEARLRTERSAATALALDSTSAEAYAALGLSRVHSWRWSEAEQAYRRAIAVDPRYATGYQWYGELLWHLGRMDESLAQMRQSVALDPLAPIASVAHSYALFAAGRLTEAMAEASKGVELAPELAIAHRSLAMSAAFAGDCAVALQHADESFRRDSTNPSTVGDKAVVYARCGKAAEAQLIAADLQRKVADNRALFPLALAYTATGDREGALKALERALQLRALGLTSYSIARDPVFDPIRRDPRFIAVLRGMGLPPSAFAAR